MKSKQKAVDLVECFMHYSDYNECDVFTQRENQLKNAKECALICVDEILEALEHNTWENLNTTILYNEVKQEINKL